MKTFKEAYQKYVDNDKLTNYEREQQGVSVVFATHNMAQARQLDAEIVVLEQGRVLGPPRKPLMSVPNARQWS